jgi:CheY-like chemotaxis protein
MGLHEDVHARLNRIRTLWAELKRTRPSAGRYNALVEAIRGDSLVYRALLEKQAGIGQTASRSKEPSLSEDVQDAAGIGARGARVLTSDKKLESTLAHPSPNIARLERINDLWLELEATRRTSARYEVLVELIHTESAASLGVSMAGTILMVDDEESVRRMTGRALRSNEFTVLEAATPERALDLFEADAGNIRLLLTDVVMPRITGPTLAQRLIGKRPDLRVLFISGYPARLEAMERGVSNRIRLLAKPFEMATLLRTVTELLTAPPLVLPTLPQR